MMALPLPNYRFPGSRLDTFVRRRQPHRPHAYPVAYRLPDYPEARSPAVQQLLRDLQHWTGWSNRTLATVLNTSHPTVAALLDGRSDLLARDRARRERLEGAHQVVSRIYLLADRDRGRTAAALSQPAFRGTSAIEHLAAGRADDAYLSALRALHPPRQGRMMIGRRPLDPRESVVPIHDED